MTPDQLYELIGYAAALLVAISLMMRSVLRLRIINLIGAAFFTLYGLLIGSWPVAGMNAFIVLINIYYLVQLARTRSAFAVVETRPNGEYLEHFFEVYQHDIERFFPHVPHPLAPPLRAWLILRDAMPVGLVVGEPESPDTLLLHMDYVIPGYRDYKPGDVFYTRQGPALRAEGFTRVCAPAPELPVHRAYLEKMGFTPSDGSHYCRPLHAGRFRAPLKERSPFGAADTLGAPLALLKGTPLPELGEGARG